MTSTNRNLTDALRFREGVALFAMIAGLDDAEARPTLRKISPHIGEPPQPDVRGVPDTWISTSSRIKYRLGEDLDAARSDADAAGMSRAVLIQHRPGRPLADSFVIMSLTDWTDVIAAKT